MSEDFKEWAKKILLASGKIEPEQVEKFLPHIEPVPEEKTGTALNKLIVDKKLGKGLVVISKHPRNVFLNLKGIFISAGATVIGTAAGVAPWAVPLLGLVAVAQFMDNMSIELGQDHAEVVLWLWDKKHQASWVFKTDLESAVAGKLKVPLDQVLDDLERLRAIEVKEEDGSIWKTEYLVIKSASGD